MISVVICGDSPAIRQQCVAQTTLEMEGVPITVGLLETDEPIYDVQASENRSGVLIKVRAFSCNYRDKALILQTSLRCQGRPTYAFIGSEFVGEVMAVGPAVTTLQVGDRVMADNCYPDPVQPGIPTQHSSRRYLLLPEAKVIKVPPVMPDEVAAAFSLNAQTAYGMLRRLEIRAGANVLVTSARSNTSLFVLNALKQVPCKVYVTTTARHFEGDVAQLGIKKVIHLDPTLPGFLAHEPMAELLSAIDGFEYVIDPFFDLHLDKVLEVMTTGGKYITCGFYDQYSHITGKNSRYSGKDLREIFGLTIVGNIQLFGNCLGETDDLRRAVADYTLGKFPIVIDSVYRGKQVDTFFERTYMARDRFGKVVYCYDDD